MLAAVWFLLIRPQQQRQKQQAEMQSRLEPGTDIVTVGGIYGRIVDADKERLLLELVDGARMQVARRAVGSVIPPEDADFELGDGDGGDMASEPVAPPIADENESHE